MILIHFCLALLTLVAGMFLLAKTRKEELGAFFKWVSYGVITLAILVLICRALVTVRCVGGGSMHHEMMMGRGHGDHMMNCCPAMGGGMRDGECRDEMKSGGGKKCCDEMSGDSLSGDMKAHEQHENH